MTIQNTIAFAADHAGVEMKLARSKLRGIDIPHRLKDHLCAVAKQHGFSTLDLGARMLDKVDYPDYAQTAGQAIVDGHAGLGVLICGSGTGMAISANKLPGIRAANCWNIEIARLAREHNDANVLCIPARFVSSADASQIMQTFLHTKFAGATRSGSIKLKEMVKNHLPNQTWS